MTFPPFKTQCEINAELAEIEAQKKKDTTAPTTPVPTVPVTTPTNPTTEPQTSRGGSKEFAAMQFYGISAYCGMHTPYPVDRFLKQFPTGVCRPAIAILLGDFGSNWTLVRQFCAMFADRPHLLEFHISNGAGRRNGHLTGNAFAPNYTVAGFDGALNSNSKAIQDALTKFLDPVAKNLAAYTNVNTRIIFSPELEDNMSDGAFASFLRMIKARTPYAHAYARSYGMGGKSSGGADYLENHGYTPVSKGYIGNGDGTSIKLGDGEVFTSDSVDPNQAATFLTASQGHCMFLWMANQQGVGQGSKVFVPGDKRNYIVTDQAIQFCQVALPQGPQIGNLADLIPFPGVPLITTIDTKNSGRFIWKPVAAHRPCAAIVTPQYYYPDIPVVTLHKNNKNHDLIETVKLWSDGHCAGNPECLYASVFNTQQLGSYYAKYGTIIVKITPGSGTGKETRSYPIYNGTFRYEYTGK